MEPNGLAQRGYPIAELSEEDFSRRAAASIADGKILGSFQGRAEWGPRALGNRSIVASPRRPEMKEFFNPRIKHRGVFRPFLPSLSALDTAQDFDKLQLAPTMSR